MTEGKDHPPASRSLFEGNVAIGNGGAGFSVPSAFEGTVQGNTAAGNAGGGFVVRDDRTEPTEGVQRVQYLPVGAPASGARIKRAGGLLVAVLLVVPALLSLVADMEGVLQFGARLGIPIERPSTNLVWGLAVIGMMGLVCQGWLWYVRWLKEPFRRLLRDPILPALAHLGIVNGVIMRRLEGHGDVGRLAQQALSDVQDAVGTLKSQALRALETPTLAGHFRSDQGQAAIAQLLNTYERAVYRLRDAGAAVHFDFPSDGNYKEWKRLDTELLERVRALISASRYTSLRQELEGSVWKAGRRDYL